MGGRVRLEGEEGREGQAQEKVLPGQQESGGLRQRRGEHVRMEVQERQREMQENASPMQSDHQRYEMQEGRVQLGQGWQGLHGQNVIKPRKHDLVTPPSLSGSTAAWPFASPTTRTACVYRGRSN